VVTANGSIGSSTFTPGNGGQVSVNASRTLTIDGSGGNGNIATGINSDAEPLSIGNAGSIMVAEAS
jgi:hypothetical protein